MTGSRGEAPSGAGLGGRLDQVVLLEAGEFGDDVVAVSYQSWGAVVLADGPDPRAVATADLGTSDRLAALLGPGRATVLRALARPGTTASLAAHLGLAPSTVSEHLAGLHAAGVVYRSRVGRRVLYGLEPTGVALLNLLDPIELGYQVRRTAS